MIPPLTPAARWKSLRHAASYTKSATSLPLARNPPSTKRTSLQRERVVHTRAYKSQSQRPPLPSRCRTVVSSRHVRYFSHSRRANETASDPIPPSSVSANEVDHFSRLASSWWDPHGPSRLLHLMNPLRFDFIQSLLPHTAESSKTYSYLDVGCGGGIFASACARHPRTSTVTAIDPTPACIAVAQAHQRRDPSIHEPQLTYLNTAIESLPPLTDGTTQKFDIITLFEVLEHVASPSDFLATAAQHLKPGGWIVGSTIARSPVSYLTTKLIAEAPVVGVVPAGTHDWNKYINPDELRGWFEKSDQWNSFTTQGVIYVPALGWRVVPGSEGLGNYFFGVQKLRETDV